MISDYLQGIICGVEHSGTTIYARLMNLNPNVVSGFNGNHECCVLKFIKDRTTDVKNIIYSNTGKRNFQLDDKTVNLIVEARIERNFEECYRLVHENSPLISEGQKIIDKTPAYVYRLREFLDMTPEINFVVVRKSLLSQCVSWRNRGIPFEKTIKSYRSNYVTQFEALGDEPRVKVVRHENLYEDPVKVIEGIHDHFGLEFPREIYSKETLSSVIKPQKPLNISDDNMKMLESKAKDLLDL